MVLGGSGVGSLVVHVGSDGGSESFCWWFYIVLVVLEGCRLPVDLDCSVGGFRQF